LAALDWRQWGPRARERVRALPRWVWFALAAAALTAILLVAFFASGPAYVPLYEGLSAKQGGQVINELQKLGIPYQLNSSGSIIRVPSPELAQARLKLGKMGVPAARGSEAWQKLVSGSLTTSQTAEDALSKRALENSLEHAIVGIQDVKSARVTLALPKSTPFLQNQPHPKASVWLSAGSSGVSTTQARAIAQMVANSVPGLRVDKVTVVDQSGDVLAPEASSGLGQAQQQLDFESRVEARAAHHIQALLAPLIGDSNLRVSAAASIDFSQLNQRTQRYGPTEQIGSLQHNRRTQQGSTNGAVGIPGALSNQPPGSAAAPLQTPQGNKSAQSAKASKNNQGGAQGGNQSPSGAQGSNASQPKSSSDQWTVHYDVNKTNTVTQQPPWRLQALSVSVVLNQNALGTKSPWVQKVKDIVSHAIAAPQLKVNVATVPFGLQHARATPRSWLAMLKSPSLMQAAMEFFAALLILLGVARPMARWVKESLPVPALALSGPELTPLQTQTPETDTNRRAETPSRVERARRLALSRPEEAAEMLRRWMAERGDESGEESAPGGGGNDRH